MVVTESEEYWSRQRFRTLSHDAPLIADNGNTKASVPGRSNLSMSQFYEV